MRIIVGIDGSPGGEEAVLAVSSRTWPPDSEVKIVIVDDPLVPTIVGSFIPPLVKTIKESNAEDRACDEELLTKAAAKLDGTGIKVTTEVRQGDPK